MPRLAAMLLVGTVLGYLAGALSVPDPGGVIRAQTVAPGDADLPPPIPPVPSPPLHPDPPGRPRHWSVDEIAGIYDARVARLRAPDATGPAAAARFDGQSFRTHSIALLGRVEHPSARPSNVIGVTSRFDDADLHEGVSDFYVMAGGTGRVAAGGYIENRQQGRLPFAPAAPTVLLPGEFNGQPLRDATVFEVEAGDWVAIPPNVPHAPGFGPREYLMYMMLKVNIGLYPTNARY